MASCDSLALHLFDLGSWEEEELTKWKVKCDESEWIEREVDNMSKVSRRTNLDDSQMQWEQEEEGSEYEEGSHEETPTYQVRERERDSKKEGGVERNTVGQVVAWKFEGKQTEKGRPHIEQMKEEYVRWKRLDKKQWLTYGKKLASRGESDVRYTWCVEGMKRRHSKVDWKK